VTRINVIDRAGLSRAVEGQSGASVMQVLKDNGFDEVLALCGGCCSCATCHVHVDPIFSDKLPQMTVYENDLLDASEHRDSTSRLSCQIMLAPALDGLVVRIAQED
jgi:2Fe-2S ferredoxin